MISLIGRVRAGGSTLVDLQQALEDYLPVLLGLVKEGTASFYFHFCLSLVRIGIVRKIVSQGFVYV